MHSQTLTLDRLFHRISQLPSTPPHSSSLIYSVVLFTFTETSAIRNCVSGHPHAAHHTEQAVKDVKTSRSAKSMHKRHCATLRSGWQSRLGITWWDVGFYRQPGCIKLTALFVLQPSYCKILKRLSAPPSFIEEYLQNKCSSHWSCYWPYGGRGCLEEDERECVCLCGAETDLCVNTQWKAGPKGRGVCVNEHYPLCSPSHPDSRHIREPDPDSPRSPGHTSVPKHRGDWKRQTEESLRKKQTRWPHGSVPDKKKKRSDGGRMGRA